MELRLSIPPSRFHGMHKDSEMSGAQTLRLHPYVALF
jgi:hypothetical protein